MIEIPLSQGKVALIDDADYEKVSHHKWSVSFCKTGQKWYARRTIRRDKKQHTIYLHRFILDAPPHLQVDHINGNGLDNRRANLRLVTVTQNRQCGRSRPNKTRLKGVCFYKSRQTYQARIVVNGKKICLGYYKTPLEAALAYDAAAIKPHGEYARLNFPIGSHRAAARLVKRYLETSH